MHVVRVSDGYVNLSNVCRAEIDRRASMSVRLHWIDHTWSDYKGNDAVAICEALQGAADMFKRAQL